MVLATSLVAALCLVMDLVTSIRSIHISLYPSYFAKVFLPLNHCAFFININYCTQGGFPAPPVLFYAYNSCLNCFMLGVAMLKDIPKEFHCKTSLFYKVDTNKLTNYYYYKHTRI